MSRTPVEELANKLEGKLLKLALWPICRFYARRLGDKPADSLYRFLCSFQFRHIYSFWPDLVKPRLFTEKLWSRMLHSRNSLLTLVCDKLRVRDYVADKVGTECLIPLLWSGSDPENIPFDDLPSRYVMKANHGCGYNIIVLNKTKLDREGAKRKLRKWLNENFGEDKYLGTGWGYKNIRPHILIESYIGETDIPPADFKFYCFSGRVELLTLHINRFGEMKSMTFNKNFKRIRFGPAFKQQDFEYPKPASYDAMVSLAEALAKGFSFIRVDLYNTGCSVYFGELTPYPVGVSQFYSFDIAALDESLGAKWIWQNPT